MNKKINNYNILFDERARFTISPDDGIFEMLPVEIINSNGTSKKVNTVMDYDTYVLLKKKPDLIEDFITRRLGHLIESEQKDDYVFLGRLDNRPDKISLPGNPRKALMDLNVYQSNRHYIIHNMDAQEYFDKIIYQSLKWKFSINKQAKINENSLFFQIKNPLADDCKIFRLIKDLVLNGHWAYGTLIEDEKSVNSQCENDTFEYLQKFENFIFLDCLDEKYNYYKKKYANNPNFKDVFNNFHSGRELNDYYLKNNIGFLARLKQNADLYTLPMYREEYEKYIKQQKIPKNILDYYLKIDKLREKIHSSFRGDNEGAMGFFVDPIRLHKLENYPSDPENIKLYINAGPDTYAFAKAFQQKCIERNIFYFFKVVEPSNVGEEAIGEQNRVDKMCIYSNTNLVKSHIEILKEIKIEHPEYEYRTPPLTTGTINTFIGVGCDPKEGSYNGLICSKLDIIIRKMFEDIDSKNYDFNTRKKLKLERLRNNPQYCINLVKNYLKQEMIKEGYSSDNICIREDIANKLKNTILEDGAKHR